MPNSEMPIIDSWLSWEDVHFCSFPFPPSCSMQLRHTEEGRTERHVSDSSMISWIHNTSYRFSSSELLLGHSYFMLQYSITYNSNRISSKHYLSLIVHKQSQQKKVTFPIKISAWQCTN